MKTSVQEHREWLAAERSGHAFLAWEAHQGTQALVVLDSGTTRVPIGRREGLPVSIPADRSVSRTHAVLERVGVDWVLIDEGLSRNGTWVNGDRVRRRRRLVSGDRIRVGQTLITYTDPRPTAPEADSSTDVGMKIDRIDALTAIQHLVLDALCTPLRANRYASPATNAEIAEALHLSLDSVKGHMRVLFRVFGLSALPQNKKRAQLAEIGVRAGLGSGPGSSRGNASGSR